MSAFGLAVPITLDLLFNAFGSFLLAAALASIAAAALGVRRRAEISMRLLASAQ